VTGGASGLGAACADRFRADGLDVVTVDRAPGADIVLDVADAEAVTAALGDVARVDILLNSAGIVGPNLPLAEVTPDAWRRTFDVNVHGLFYVTRAVVPGMVERGWGRVVFVSSESSVFTPTEMVHYGMTKTAQLAVARGMAQAVKGTGVTVNSVLPGPTLTPGVEEFIRDRVGEGGEAEFVRTERPTLLLGRLIRPHEVANLITYVASDLSSATTGAALRVDGGTAPTLIP